MASRGLGYGYGTGGKIRRRPSSRAALSPYARPAPAPATSKGGGWFTRVISAGASRLLPSLFRKPPPQLAAPPPPPEPVDATHSRPEAPQEPLLLRQDVGPAFIRTQPEPLDAPPSPPPPPLEDDLPEGEESGRAAVDILPTENSAKNGEEDMLRNFDEHGLLDFENLLKQRTFKRREFEYLSELLWSRTVGSNSLKLDDGNEKKMHVSDKEIGSMRSNLPVDFSVRTYSFTDTVASPAEIAKAYMGSKSPSGSSLRLRLHDSSSLTIKSMEASVIQQARPPTIPVQGSRLNTSETSDSLKRNFSTPNRSAIYKMSQTPYFKSAASSDDLFSNVSSHRTPSSVHTYGRQVLKRKSSAVNNEMVSVGPIRKMRHRYSRTSSLLETPTGYRGHLCSHGSKLNKDSEHSAQTQKRRCLSKVGHAALGGLDDKTHTISFGQAPKQSAEMATKILKELDTLVPSQKEGAPEIKKKHGIAMDIKTQVPHKKEIPVESNLSEPSTSGVQDCSLLNGIYGNVTVTPAHVTEKSVDATSNTSASLTAESISQFTSPDVKPQAFSRSYPPNLVLSSEVDRNKMSITSSGFTFPVPAVLGTHSQAPPTPTMASPPVLPIEKLQTTPSSNGSVTSEESGPKILKSVSNEGSVAQKGDKFSAGYQLMSSKSSGQVTSFTCNPVFKFSNAKLATSSNGLQHTSNSMVSDILPARGSSQNAGSFSIPTNLASAQNVSTGGGLTISSSGTGGLSAVTGATTQCFEMPSLSSSGSGSDTAFTIFPQLGTASSPSTTKVVNSNTPFTFSQQFGTASSSAQDKSKAASTESTILSGNQHAQPRNSNAMFTANSNAPLGDPSSGSSLFSSAAGTGSPSVTTSVSAFSPISSFSTVSGPVFSASPVFGSKWTATASTSLSKFDSATSPLSSAPSAVFSFTGAAPIPNSLPTVPIFGGVSPVTTSTTGTGQMSGGNMITDRKESPFSTTSSFGTPSNSPSTPIFSSPATQFAPSTPSPEIFKFGEQNASSGAFSIGTGGGNEKSGRKFIRVKRRK